MITQVCQSCNAQWSQDYSPDPIPCPRCSSPVTSIRYSTFRLDTLMTNLEFMAEWNKYHDEVLNEMIIQNMTDAQMIAYQHEKIAESDRIVEREKIKRHVHQKIAQELGSRVKIQIHESDLKYEPTPEVILSKKRNIKAEERAQLIKDLENI